VKLRVSNNYLFSGKRNTSMWAWTILKHMGLHRKMTHTQASKKWENMKKRYKQELKNPPDGVEVFPDAWPYFSLMDDAMAGRLVASAPILKAFPYSKDNGDFLIKPKKKKIPAMVRSSTVAAMPEIDISLNGNEDGEGLEAQEGSQDIDCILQEVEDEGRPMHNEQQVAEREKEVMERERLVLQRERAVLDREIAVLDRDRAVLEREKAALEREKAVMERERAMVERARDAVSRDRLALEQKRAKLGRLCETEEGSEVEEVTENSSSGSEKDLDAVDRKQRLIFLFEKLIDNF
uniref:Si:dkeyp-38g8.5 n=1 Tax=Amphilophus citrinellus TaxID=61819 RepID=A0A3Q0R191_AMPCI